MNNKQLKVCFYSVKPYDIIHMEKANEASGHVLNFHEEKATAKSAAFASGHDAICTFVNDKLDKQTLEAFAANGVRLVVLRCAGFNQVDLSAAAALGMAVVRVPSYSPNAVAEHAVALLMTGNRQIHRAFNRIREHNFSLDGLYGFDMCGKTVGVMGTGKIGAIFARIMVSFGCKVLAVDTYVNEELVAMGVTYTDLPDLYAQSDVISLHCNLTKENYHMIDAKAIDQVKKGVFIVNTSRGGLIDANAAIAGLKSKKIGFLAIDVYEQEAKLFFDDHNNDVGVDDTFQFLLTFPNVLITGHQAFFTKEALSNIADCTVQNLNDFAAGTTATSANIVKQED